MRATDCAPSTSNARRRLSHRLGIEVLMVLPPLPVCIGTRPRYAATTVQNELQNHGILQKVILRTGCRQGTTKKAKKHVN